MPAPAAAHKPAAKAPKAAEGTNASREGTASALVIGVLQRKGGVALEGVVSIVCEPRSLLAITRPQLFAALCRDTEVHHAPTLSARHRLKAVRAVKWR
jgi:hypothetical protein